MFDELYNNMKIKRGTGNYQGGVDPRTGRPARPTIRRDINSLYDIIKPPQDISRPTDMGWDIPYTGNKSNPFMPTQPQPIYDNNNLNPFGNRAIRVNNPFGNMATRGENPYDTRMFDLDRKLMNLRKLAGYNTKPVVTRGQELDKMRALMEFLNSNYRGR